MLFLHSSSRNVRASANIFPFLQVPDCLLTYLLHRTATVRPQLQDERKWTTDSSSLAADDVDHHFAALLWRAWLILIVLYVAASALGKLWNHEGIERTLQRGVHRIGSRCVV